MKCNSKSMIFISTRIVIITYASLSEGTNSEGQHPDLAARARARNMAPDGKLYNSGRKGELYELKEGLNSSVAKERKTALKRTVAAMTLGKDVSSLFTDVIKNTATDLSMKKLVYLYIINYAKSNPELALLVINTFIKDAHDPHPLIRALAIRTMALIPLDNMVEHLCDPLRSALGDRDAYVQKTAAIAVAKLHDTHPAVVREEGFIDDLQLLLGASNPMTVANAVAALAEIADSSGDPSVIGLSPSSVPRFLAALSECTEWGQVFILDAIATYRPADAEEADAMVERVVPRLQHSNAAVVLSAVRLIVALMPLLDVQEKRDFLSKKMSPPLLSLLSAPPELQFVALRNIALLAVAHADMFNADVKMFFASYSDPLYVKVEKLDILVRLSNASNAEVILAELREYADEVDVAFVRRAVASIGRLVVKQPSIADRAVAKLVELLKARVPHIVEEVAVALADILRAYPGRFDATIAPLCEAAEIIGDPIARTALVWIIGEHAAQIPDIVGVLGEILDSMPDEGAEVQLQILSACFKAYLVHGDAAAAVFQRGAEFATVECVNIDVRERGFLYLRLAEANREDVKKVVLAKKPGINADSHNLDPELLEELLGVLSSLAAVYHKPISEFRGVRERGLAHVPPAGVTQEEDLLGLDGNGQERPSESLSGGLISSPAASNGKKSLGASLLDDLFGSSGGAVSAAAASSAPLTGDSNLAFGAGQIESPGEVLFNSEGLVVRGGLAKDDAGRPAIAMMFENQISAPMARFGIQLDKNAFGLGIVQPLRLPDKVQPHSSQMVKVSLSGNKDADLTKGTHFAVALRYMGTSQAKKVVYFKLDIGDRLDVLLDPNGAMPKAQFLTAWQSLPDSAEQVSSLSMPAHLAFKADSVREIMKQHHIFPVARRTAEGRKIAFYSARIMGPWECTVMCELSMPIPGGPPVGKLASRCILGGAGKPFLDAFSATIARILNT